MDEVFEALAEVLSRFLGYTVYPEELASFDSISLSDMGTKFQLDLTVDMGSGDYVVKVSDYLQRINPKEFRTGDYDAVLSHLSDITEELNHIYDGIKALTLISDDVAILGPQIQLELTANYASSSYLIILGDTSVKTYDPQEAADRISGYIYESLDRYIDDINKVLTGYTFDKVVYGENFEMYHEGLFLSIFYRHNGEFSISFHPSPNPDHWSSARGKSRKDLNKELSNILRRLK